MKKKMRNDDDEEEEIHSWFEVPTASPRSEK